MSNGEIAYLTLVLFIFGSFMGVLGFVSIWSRFPNRTQTTKSAPSNVTAREHQNIKSELPRSGVAGNIPPHQSTAA